MSSPLDSRMRLIAREEVTALLGVPDGVRAVVEPGPTMEQLQGQIAELRNRLDALEEAPERPAQEDRPTVKRAPRKAGGSTATPE